MEQQASLSHSDRPGTPGEMPPTAPEKPKLLVQLAEALQARHYSRRTVKAYRHWVKRFILFHDKRHPEKMGDGEINRFLTYLAVERHVTSGTQTQALSALLFLYRQVLGREVGELEGLIRARKSRTLPVVLTRDEVWSIIDELSGQTKLIALLLYGAGLRVRECIRLRVKDIPFVP